MSGVKQGSGRKALEASIAKAGGRIVSQEELQDWGRSWGDNSCAGGVSLKVQQFIDEEKFVLLCDAPAGEKPLRTVKLLFGLALGLKPLRPAWASECIQRGATRKPQPEHYPHASRRTAPKLLAGWSVVMLGKKVLRGRSEWRSDFDALLRAAGAEVRSELPAQHHAASSAGQRCVVMLEDRELAADGLVARAEEREYPVVLDEWLKQCLVQQRLLPPGEAGAQWAV